MNETVYILSGSNLGNREYNLEVALEKMEEIPGLEIIATSAVYVSEAMDMVGEHPSFLNQVIMAEYQFLPMEFLNALEAIETKMGRTDKGKKKPRNIDLDILLFGNQIIETDKLVVPHKKLTKRPFALIPLLQVSPELTHPKDNQPLKEFVKKTDYNKVILYKDHVARNI